MSIVSFYFFIFVAVSLFIYYICPLKIRMYVPLIASIVFFIWGCGLVMFAVMCGMAMIAWFGALSVGKDAGKHKWIAGAAIVLLAAVLIVFKENSFFTTNADIIGKLFKLNIQIDPPAWAAPLGVSYFTLMLISYLADVSWGKISAEKNPLKVLLFTCYFPQMTLGPFSRYGEMREYNLFTGNKFDYNNFCFGLQRMLWGLFKKLVLAERLAIIVKTIYDGAAAGTHNGIYIIIGAIAYVFQLYTDFSGAIDIIIGVSQMFGIKLPENFRQPFFSRSLSEIWRRWHMTLGLWLKDYVMYPVQKGLTSKFGRKAQKLFGKRLGKNLLLYLSLLITWFCVGFWHGGSWKYICSSGLFFFVMIVSGMILQPLFDKLKKLLRINTNAWSWHLFESVRSFSLFALSVSFGRAASLPEGFKFWKLAFNYNPWVLYDGSLLKLGLDAIDFTILISGMLIMLIVSILQLKGGIRQRLASQNLTFRWAVYLCMFFAVIIFGMYGEGYNPADFIYGGF
jgi:alginate O-acetyltransferase complex protein AlgI